MSAGIFINGSEFEGSHKVGVNRRTRVCNMEIWCECFGKERGNLKRQDANEIAAIMSNIEGVETPGRKDAFFYLRSREGLCP